MKIWIKLLIAGVLGMAIGLYLPDYAGETDKILSYFNQLAVSVGRFVLFPLVFFGLTVAVYELSAEKRLLKTYALTLSYTAITSFGMIVMGVFLVSVLSPGRIPILIEENLPVRKPELGAMILQLFPRNLFSLFLDSGDFLLPLVFFAFLLGLNLTFDRQVARPILELSNSLCRVFYHINALVSEFIYIGCIAMAASLVFNLRRIGELHLFLELFFVLGLFVVVVGFGIFPAALYFIGGKKAPFRWMFAQLGPAIGALLSGDLYFSTGLSIRHGAESLGIPRRVGSVTYPFAAIFGRGGTGMVTVVSFIVILRSYSSLEIGLFQLIWVMLISFFVSFALGTVPGSGALVGIAVLSGLYGRGMEEGFLILKPIAPILVSFGVFLDTIAAGFVSVLVSDRMKLTRKVESRDLI